jgi:hypothetical protein
MLTPTARLSPGFAAVVFLFTGTSTALAANADDCKAANPTLKGAAMSEKLRRCNGVLKPSKAADPDIIIPTPSIDDPLAIHPKQMPDKGVPK